MMARVKNSLSVVSRAKVFKLYVSLVAADDEPSTTRQPPPSANSEMLKMA